MPTKTTPAKSTLSRVLEVIQEHPNSTARQVAEITSYHQTSVGQVINTLVASGDVFVSPDRGYHGARQYIAKEKSRTLVLHDTVRELTSEMWVLRDENTKLKDWKQAAIEKYPDLADPDPVTLRVRELLIEDWPEDAEHINGGLWDEKNAAKALRRQVEAEA